MYTGFGTVPAAMQPITKDWLSLWMNEWINKWSAQDSYSQKCFLNSVRTSSSFLLSHIHSLLFLLCCSFSTSRMELLPYFTKNCSSQSHPGYSYLPTSGEQLAALSVLTSQQFLTLLISFSSLKTLLWYGAILGFFLHFSQVFSFPSFLSIQLSMFSRSLSMWP